MMQHFLVAGLATCLIGCTTVQYQRGTTDVDVVNNTESSFGSEASESTWDFSSKTQTLTGWDSTGAVCASAGTAASAHNARQKAMRRAARTGYGSAKYRVFRASSFSGVRCGGYVRWGGGERDEVVYTTTQAGGMNATGDAKTEHWDAAFLIDWGVPLSDGTFINPHIKFGVGQWKVHGANGVDGVEADLADVSVGATMHFSPSWLFGVSIHPSGELNIAGGITYGALADYTFALSEVFALSMNSQWMRRSQVYPGEPNHTISKELSFGVQLAYLFM